MNELIEKNEKWELLFKEIVNMNYNDIILHDEIVSIIQEEVESHKYYSIIGKAKKKLLEKGKYIKSVKGQGYIVINPDDYTDESLSCVKSGFRKVDKGFKILNHAPTNDMSKDGLNRYRHVSDRAKTLHAMVAGGCTELKLLNKTSKIMIRDNNN